MTRGVLHLIRVDRDRNCVALSFNGGIKIRFPVRDPIFAVASLRIAAGLTPKQPRNGKRKA